MNVCPECKNVFAQSFVCTTCGSEKLYDATLKYAQQRAEKAERELAAALRERDMIAQDVIEMCADVCFDRGLNWLHSSSRIASDYSVESESCGKAILALSAADIRAGKK